MTETTPAYNNIPDLVARFGEPDFEASMRGIEFVRMKTFIDEARALNIKIDWRSA